MTQNFLKDLFKAMFKFLLDRWPQSEGSCKTGSVHSSFCLSVSFLGIGSLVFSETQHSVMGSYKVVCDRVRFFEKNLNRAKMTKNGQKWPKNRVFELFKKIASLFLPEICIKRNFLWFINILRKLHAWEISGSQVIAKNVSQPMRFQYSLIVNILLTDKYLALIFGM